MNNCGFGGEYFFCQRMREDRQAGLAGPVT